MHHDDECMCSHVLPGPHLAGFGCPKICGGRETSSSRPETLRRYGLHPTGALDRGHRLTKAPHFNPHLNNKDKPKLKAHTSGTKRAGVCGLRSEPQREDSSRGSGLQL